jgi:hypothetical protein
MNQQLNRLLLKRGRLLERIATQRASLSRDLQPVNAALETTDRLLARVHAGVVYLKTHPAGVTALALAALYIVKPARVFRWSMRAFSTWQTWRIMRDKFVIPGS